MFGEQRLHANENEAPIVTSPLTKREIAEENIQESLEMQPAGPAPHHVREVLRGMFIAVLKNFYKELRTTVAPTHSAVTGIARGFQHAFSSAPLQSLLGTASSKDGSRAQPKLVLTRRGNSWRAQGGEMPRNIPQKARAQLTGDAPAPHTPAFCTGYAAPGISTLCKR